MSATYSESPAPEPLASHACCVWSNAAGPGGHLERVLPDGCADVVWIEGAGMVVAGPATREVLVDIPAGSAALGVRFGPGAAGAALGLAARELRDRTVALEDLWGAQATELAERLAGAPPASRLGALTAAVARRLDGARAPDGLVAHASSLLAAGMPVTAASREVALTDRHLRRRFHDAVGYGPKTLQLVLRLRRFLALAESGPSPDLARAAADAGYSDQPHLTRECADLTGLPPAALLASREAARRAAPPGAAQAGRRSRNGSASPGSSSWAMRSASPISTS
jgi:AraC-like DNA-binding protein